MAKDKTVFVCRECGHESSKWMGQCPGCRAWNTMEEAVVTAPKGGMKTVAAGRPAVRLADVDAMNDARWTTGFGELDRVLGGGVVEGSVVLAGRRTGDRQIDSFAAGG